MCITTAIYNICPLECFHNHRSEGHVDSKQQNGGLYEFGRSWVSFGFFYLVSYALLRNKSLSLVAKVCVITDGSFMCKYGVRLLPSIVSAFVSQVNENE